MPKRATVPEHWKWENGGPYKKAPAEYGGEWWMVNPFYGEKPWENQGPVVKPKLPEGFADLFGSERPDHNSHTDPAARRVAIGEWEDAREYFKRAGVPEGVSQAELADAQVKYAAWKMGRVAFYEGRYGWRGMFPDAKPVGYRTDPETILRTPDIVIANWQIKRLLIGEEIPEAERHPYVPGHLFQ